MLLSFFSLFACLLHQLDFTKERKIKETKGFYEQQARREFFLFLADAIVGQKQVLQSNKLQKFVLLLILVHHVVLDDISKMGNEFQSGSHKISMFRLTECSRPNAPPFLDSKYPKMDLRPETPLGNVAFSVLGNMAPLSGQVRLVQKI